ncbi:hypothetical protein BDQ17DRAFT_1428299 [Cyathus striatus]|nr:hypothetical protein BDQ17DRAFT_1428299 [Cyathus striatus]
MAQRLRGFYTYTRDIDNLNRSILYAHQASEMCPESHSKNATIFYNLADALFTRHQHLKELQDLEEALQNFNKCMKILPVNNYLRAEYSIREVLESELVVMSADIIQLHKAAGVEATSSPIHHRFQAAILWAKYEESRNPEAALEAYIQAINFLPRLKSFGTKLVKMQESFKLSNTNGVSHNASLNAITIGKYNNAIEFLEAGPPKLEAKFARISAELERATLKVELHDAGGHTERLMCEEETVQLGELNEEWEQTLNKIHQLDGFNNFLLPKGVSSLQASAKHPVVYLIPHEYESHALIMLSDCVKHVPLPNAPYKRLQGMMFQLPAGGGRGAELDPYEFKSNVWEQLQDIHNDEWGGRPIRSNEVD